METGHHSSTRIQKESVCESVIRLLTLRPPRLYLHPLASDVQLLTRPQGTIGQGQAVQGCKDKAKNVGSKANVKAAGCKAKIKDLGFKVKAKNFGIKAKAKAYHHCLER